MSGHLVALAAGWVAYFALHSALASLPVKHWAYGRWPRLSAAYRLLYNAQSVILLLPLLYGVYTWPGPLLWQWRGTAAWLADGLAVAAVAGFLWSLRYYSGAEFLGTRQWRRAGEAPEDQEGLTISPLHRYVRHPWYLFGLVILWTRDMDAALLTSAVFISGYFWVGSRLEEQKLLRYHGAAYARYMKAVPPLLPRPWRHLSPAEAEAIEDQAQGHR